VHIGAAKIASAAVGKRQLSLPDPSLRHAEVHNERGGQAGGLGAGRWRFARAGHLDSPDARDRASWQHGGGFSLDVRLPIATERYSLTVE